jgi:hypothetical protein
MIPKKPAPDLIRGGTRQEPADDLQVPDPPKARGGGPMI